MQKETIQKLRIGVVVLCILGIVTYVVVSSAQQKEDLPRAFLDSRVEAAQISQHIVELTRNSASLIEQVSLSGLGADADEATGLINQARENNRKAHESAFELSQTLKLLAESLTLFSSRKTQRLAYEAVAVELSLVAEFIDYTQRLNTFLDALSKAVVTNRTDDRKAAEYLLGPVNESARNINELNGNFLEKVKELDNSL